MNRILRIFNLHIRAAQAKAAKKALEQDASALARESSKVFFEHLAGYKARPF